MAIHTQIFNSRADWEAARCGRIGASDVGAIVGVSHFATPLQVWHRLATGERVPESVAMKMGHMLEPVVAQLWAEESGDAMIEGSDRDFIVTNDDYGFASVSPDRYFAGRDGREYVVECKTTSLRVDEECLPKSWYCQLQYQLAVTDLPRGVIAWLSNGREFGHVDYERNDEFCDWLLKRVEDFWESLQSGAAPEATPEDADFVFKKLGVPGSTTTASPETIAAITRYRELRDAVRDAEAEMDNLAKSIKLAMGSSECLVADGNTLATWKVRKGSRTIDAKKLKENYPQAYDACARSSEQTRVFKIS